MAKRKLSAMDQGYGSISSTSRGEYEVFLSFRGLDTQKGFTDFLYTYLRDADILTFKDDNELRVGEEIGPELLKAIKESKILIPIFSKNYASSKWCLRELAQIVECHTNEGQMIYPIFYDVNPYEVRHQSGSYKDAFSQHKNNFDEMTVQGWKEAMRKVGQLKGLELIKETNGHEGQLVKKVVQDVLLGLKKNYTQLPDNLVGLDDHIKAMKELLNVDSNGIRVVGIHGIGGLGKTTIAKVIYNQLCEGFERCCFIEDVRVNSKGQNGIVELQTHLLCKIRKKEVGKINNVDEGIKQIEEAVGKKKVIIVLDDVDDKYQFDKLVGKCNLFGAGSRIIVTTRNKGLLDTIEATYQIENLHDVYGSYEPHLMKSIHSLELFSNYAFMRDSPPEDYGSLAQKVVSSAGGLPLVLVTLGSLLFGKKDIALWEEKLRKLKEAPPEEVLERLRISFDALDYWQRQIFLDIACFFIGEDYINCFYFWEACGFYPRDGLNVLVLRSIIKIEDDNKLRMHDQLRDLGRQIVREKNMDKPGKCSRLWCSEQASKLWEGRMVTRDVEALNLRNKSVCQPQCLVGKDFKKLRNLRYLSLGWADLDGDFKQRLSNLKWLDWECSGNCWPTNCHLKNLVVLNLSVKNIPDNWKGWSEIEMAKELKVLTLYGYNSNRASLISNFKSLGSLSVHAYFNLEEFDPSIRNLTNLRVLDLSLCESLGALDCSSFSALENLNLSRCRKLRRLDGLEQLKSLRYLNLSDCRELEILLDLSNFKKLKKLGIAMCMKLTGMQGLDSLESFDVLNMSCCISVKRLRGLSNLRMLKELLLDDCRNLRELDEVGVLESLELLDMSDCISIERLPDLSKLTKLKKLDLCGCEMLREVKGLSVLKSLEYLNLDCKSMEEFPDLSNLKKLVDLSICGWHDLTEIRGLEELKSLVWLSIISCSSIEQLSDLSNHKNLKYIDVLNCEKLTGIRGIEEVKSLENIDIWGCNSLNLPRLPNARIGGP
ncbi:hypothetical protein LguiA_012738 [Lonicera macranthoides]